MSGKPTGDGAHTVLTAFEILFRRHAASLRRHVRAAATRQVSPDDVVAETFLVAWRLRDRVPADPAQAEVWLLQTAWSVLARHDDALARDHALSRRLQGRLSGPDVADEVTYRWELRERLAMAAAALSRLSPPERETVKLYVIGHLSYAEIAAATGTPLNTVRARLVRGRRRLRGLAEQEAVRARWRRCGSS
ncbi:sigma-70 family RNA polymerase sigma factor [Streptomyces sp. NPDC093516]|uniref:RNA polymerase sigma factor n=1 Tax=Streptomyces sp. NPDC093516 TaxID=3155304 RepID=UPI00342635F5